MDISTYKYMGVYEIQNSDQLGVYIHYEYSIKLGFKTIFKT